MKNENLKKNLFISSKNDDQTNLSTFAKKYLNELITKDVNLQFLFSNLFFFIIFILAFDWWKYF